MSTQTKSHEWTDEIATWYAEEHGDWPGLVPIIAAAGIQSRDRVLDIGCGTGSALRLVAPKTTRRLVGIDPSPVMISLAGGHHQRIDYFQAAAEHIPLDDACVDLVLAINSLHHWQDVAAGLAEAARVLAKGGRLVVAEETAIVQRHGFTAEKTELALTGAGFTVRESQLVGTDDLQSRLISATR
jgi:ubiquinone/menaquinone biosynthesis C-methylase UbiE